MTEIEKINRFWSRADKTEGCWNWTGAKNKKGYGELIIFGKWQRAHRVAWTIVNGEIPNGLHVLHKCDNPSCIKPDHLMLGTNLDNQRDCVFKGRHVDNNGTKSPRSKISKDQVGIVRTLHQEGKRIAEISVLLGINRYSVGRIVRGVSFKYD